MRIMFIFVLLLSCCDAPLRANIACRDVFSQGVYDSESEGLFRNITQVMLWYLELLEQGVAVPKIKSDHRFNLRLYMHHKIKDYIDKRIGIHNRRVYFHIIEWIKYSFDHMDTLDSDALKSYQEFLLDIHKL